MWREYEAFKAILARSLLVYMELRRFQPGKIKWRRRCPGKCEREVMGHDGGAGKEVIVYKGIWLAKLPETLRTNESSSKSFCEYRLRIVYTVSVYVSYWWGFLFIIGSFWLPHTILYNENKEISIFF